MLDVHPVTGWTQNILHRTCHRVDTEHLTSHLSQGGHRMSYIAPVTGWTQNVLHRTCHRVDTECLTSHLSQGGYRMSYIAPVTGWTQNVLLPFCHRIDLECFTSNSTHSEHQVDPNVSLRIPRNLNTWWTRKGLLPITIICNYFQGSKICPILSMMNLVMKYTDLSLFKNVPLILTKNQP